MLGRASDLEALGLLSREVSLASKPEELLIAIAHRCRKLIITESLAKDFITIGVKYAALCLIRPYVRQFAREYKAQQAASSLT
jgi:hypothetical protein